MMRRTPYNHAPGPVGNLWPVLRNARAGQRELVCGGAVAKHRRRPLLDDPALTSLVESGSIVLAKKPESASRGCLVDAEEICDLRNGQRPWRGREKRDQRIARRSLHKAHLTAHVLVMQVNFSGVFGPHSCGVGARS